MNLDEKLIVSFHVNADDEGWMVRCRGWILSDVKGLR
jgi:hypothetical protein